MRLTNLSISVDGVNDTASLLSDAFGLILIDLTIVLAMIVDQYVPDTSGGLWPGLALYDVAVASKNHLNLRQLFEISDCGSRLNSVWRRDYPVDRKVPRV